MITNYFCKQSAPLIELHAPLGTNLVVKSHFLIGLITHQDQAGWFFGFCPFQTPGVGRGAEGGLKGGGRSYKLGGGASAERSRFGEI